MGRLFVMDQEEGYFRIWMVQWARRSLSGTSEFETRFALAADADFLRELAGPDRERYVEDWTRAGDLGVVAMACSEADDWQPVAVGAAWLRRFAADSPDAAAEPIVCVVAAQRGRGVEGLLIARLRAEADLAGIPIAAA